MSMLAVSLDFCSNSPLFENFFVIVTHPKLKILMPKRCPKMLNIPSHVKITSTTTERSGL